MPDTSFFVNKAGPVHAATYISTDQVILASGAGPSKTGQKNRIAAYSLSQSLASSTKAAERKGVCTVEALLADDEDAPSSFALIGDLLIAGVNESETARKSTGDNHHLRTFRLGTNSSEKGETITIKKSLEHQIYDNLSLDSDEYQKVTKISEDGKYAGLITSEGHPAIVDLSKMQRLSIEVLDKQEDGGRPKIEDLEFNKDTVWVVTTTNITSISLPHGDEVSTLFNLKNSGIPRNFTLTKILFISTDAIVLAMNHSTLNHGFIAIYKMYKGALHQSKIAHTSSRIRGLYVNTRRPTPSIVQLLAMTTADGTLTVYDNDLLLRKSWKKLHQFPISTVAFRSDGKQLITASIDEKVNVLDLTDLRPPMGFLAYLMILLLLLFSLYAAHAFRQGKHEYWLNLVDQLIIGRRARFQDL